MAGEHPDPAGMLTFVEGAKDVIVPQRRFVNIISQSRRARWTSHLPSALSSASFAAASISSLNFE